MDHLEARELLDLAAVEPGGLDRLIAGDTFPAIALAGHLAGCPECTEEFDRLRRASVLLRDVIGSQPRPELRSETLAFVAAVGRPRGDAAGASAGSTAAEAMVRAPDAAPSVPPEPVPLRSRRTTGGRLAWIAAAAALVIATAGVTGYAVASAKDSASRQASQQLEGLTEVASWTVRLDTQPDVQRVLLTASGGATSPGAALLGTLEFSPGTRQIVVVAEGIAPPPAGGEYRCWVEMRGKRERLGRMYISGDLAYWVGDAGILATVPAGSVFGVSLSDPANPAAAAAPLLSGTLQST